MADIERALGRPERALELARSPEARDLGRAETVELAIVAAGARRDLGELDVAVVGLQLPELDPALREPWSARLFYAYADNLLAAGRESDALQWFVHATDADPDGVTDADVRIAELTGEPLPEDDVIGFDVEDLTELESVDPGEVEDTAESGDVEDTPDSGEVENTAGPGEVEGPVEPSEDTVDPEAAVEPGGTDNPTPTTGPADERTTVPTATGHDR
jgi:hypothetical protein